MGSSNYSSATFQSSVGATARTLGAKATFAHSAAVASGQAHGIHESLNPRKKNGAGVVIREARDSDTHPDTVPILVLLDVTGSMGQVPVNMVPKLPKIPSLLVEKGFVDHPTLCFMAVDDAKYAGDRCFQASQFESGNEIDQALTNIDLVGNGGGNGYESYDLALWYIQNRVVTDAWEKRKEKGYLFIIGDEMVQERTLKSEIIAFADPDAVLEGDLKTKDVIEALKEKWNIYWIRPAEGSHYDNKAHYQELFGERVFMDVATDAVTELICMTVGAEEGHDVHSIAGALKDDGSCDASIKSATTALASYTGLGKGKLIKKAGTVDGQLPEDEESAAGAGRL